MNTTTKTLLIAGTAALFALVSELGAAEGAGRHHNSGGLHRSHDSAQYFNNNRRIGMNHPQHRRGSGGIYLSLGAGSGCSAAYSQWQVSGSQYWRSRYNDCVNG